jgi:hypothetical protein
MQAVGYASNENRHKSARIALMNSGMIHGEMNRHSAGHDALNALTYLFGIILLDAMRE